LITVPGLVNKGFLNSDRGTAFGNPLATGFLITRRGLRNCLLAGLILGALAAGIIYRENFQEYSRQLALRQRAISVPAEIEAALPYPVKRFSWSEYYQDVKMAINPELGKEFNDWRFTVYNSSYEGQTFIWEGIVLTRDWESVYLIVGQQKDYFAKGEGLIRIFTNRDFAVPDVSTGDYLVAVGCIENGQPRYRQVYGVLRNDL